MKPLPYEELVKENRPQFLAKVREIAQRLDVPPSWLMVVMRYESGIDHRRGNGLGYYGLIQFGAQARQELGVSTSQLINMSNVEQLEYVYRFYAKYAGQYTEFSDLYLMTLWPRAFIKKYPGSWRFPANVCSINRLPSSCLLKDYRAKTNEKVPEGYPVYKSAWHNPTNVRNGGILSSILLIIGILLIYDYYFYNWAYSRKLFRQSERKLAEFEKQIKL